MKVVDYEEICEMAQEKLDDKFREYFNKPAPRLSPGLIKIVLEAADEHRKIYKG